MMTSSLPTDPSTTSSAAQQPTSAGKPVDGSSTSNPEFAFDDAIARFTGLALAPSGGDQNLVNAKLAAQATLAARLNDAGANAESLPASEDNSNSNNSNDQDDSENRDNNNNNNDQQDDLQGRNSDHAATHGYDESDPTVLTLRALVSTKEAGVIIGKGGKNVAQVRDETGVKAGVSSVIPGVHERVLMITGPLDAVSKAFSLIARQLLDNPTTTTPPSAINHNAPTSPDATTIRLLIGHQLMGSIIGKAGSNIKALQEETATKVVVSKEMLPQSTERVVEITGTIDSIHMAIRQIAQSLLNDAEKAVGVIHYNPQVLLHSNTSPNRYESRYAQSTGNPALDYNYRGGNNNANNASGPRRSYNNAASSSSSFNRSSPTGRRTNTNNGFRSSSTSTSTSTFRTPRFNNNRNFQTPEDEFAHLEREEFDPETGAALVTTTLSIPADMCGCIIGKGGSTINNLREKSGSRISISKRTNEAGERLFHIRGLPESNEKALYLLYERLEDEKQRRLVDGESVDGGDLEEEH